LPGISNFAAEGYMYLDIPSIMNYNIASCYPQTAVFEENARLRRIIIDSVSSKNMIGMA
jgi:hypothetical protein